MYYKANIEKQTLKNNNYRKVLSTTTNMQLVLMSIEEGDEIGLEKHHNATQFIRVESGTAKAIIGRSKFFLKSPTVSAINLSARMGTIKLKGHCLWECPMSQK